ncbi:hypothetical protein AX16_006802 [Volvariella volvacea WC 439]|nr:hypothetical protein AX16_006802 [Volvariella volvacea WC 439]
MFKALVRVRQRFRSKQKQSPDTAEIVPGQQTQPPSLHRNSGYATPFPPVSTGGYTKYYDTRAAQPSNTADSENPSNAPIIKNAGNKLRHNAAAAPASSNSSSSHTKNASGSTTDTSLSSCISAGSSSVTVEHSTPPTSECEGEQRISYVMVDHPHLKGSQPVPAQSPASPSPPVTTSIAIGAKGLNLRGAIGAGAGGVGVGGVVPAGGRQAVAIPPINTKLPTPPEKPGSVSVSPPKSIPVPAPAPAPGQDTKPKSQSQPNAITRFLQRSQTQPKKKAPVISSPQQQQGQKRHHSLRATPALVPPPPPSSTSGLSTRPSSAAVSTPISAISTSSKFSSSPSDSYPPHSGFNGSSAGLSTTQSSHLTIPSVGGGSSGLGGYAYGGYAGSGGSGAGGSVRAGSVRSYVSGTSSYMRRKKVPSSRSLKALRAHFAAGGCGQVASVPSGSGSASIAVASKDQKHQAGVGTGGGGVAAGTGAGAGAGTQGGGGKEMVQEDDNDEEYVDESGVEEDGVAGANGGARTLRTRKRRIQLRKSASAIKRLAIVKEEAAKRNSGGGGGIVGVEDGPNMKTVNGVGASQSGQTKKDAPKPKGTQVASGSRTASPSPERAQAHKAGEALKVGSGSSQKIVAPANTRTNTASPLPIQSTKPESAKGVETTPPKSTQSVQGSGQGSQPSHSRQSTPHHRSSSGSASSHPPPSSFKYPDVSNQATTHASPAASTSTATSSRTPPLSKSSQWNGVTTSRTAPPPPPKQQAEKSILSATVIATSAATGATATATTGAGPSTATPKVSSPLAPRTPSPPRAGSTGAGANSTATKPSQSRLLPKPNPSALIPPPISPSLSSSSPTSPASLSPPPPRPARNPDRKAIMRKRSSNRSMNVNALPFRLSTEGSVSGRSINSSIGPGGRRVYGSWVVRSQLSTRSGKGGKEEDLEWVDESDDDDGTASFFSARSKLSER